MWTWFVNGETVFRTTGIGLIPDPSKVGGIGLISDSGIGLISDSRIGLIIDSRIGLISDSSTVGGLLSSHW